MPVADLTQAYDVLIAGGGPAGLGAALAARQAGARTLLLERYGFLGGVASNCLGMPMNQMRPGGQPRGKIHEQIIEAVLAYGAEAANVVGHALVCNVTYLKAAAMDAMDKAGCDYLLHAPVVEVCRDGNRIRGVVIATKQGYRAVEAKITVDCTGDADIAFLGGAETLKGHEGDGYLSPMTMCILITNVDVPGARAFQGASGLEQFLETARAKYPLLPEKMHFELGPFPMENSLVINHAGTKRLGTLDGTSPFDMTQADRFSYHQAIQMVEALREFGGPAFARVQLAATGPQTSVRETRRVKGLYQLTEEDALSGARFEDVIAWRSGMLDIGFVRYQPMKVHDVPYRAIVPETVDGLLAAGRCISATHVAASAGKSMGNCVATGHAAGLAAAMCVQRGIQPRALQVRELQERLAQDGVDLTAKYLSER